MNTVDTYIGENNWNNATGAAALLVTCKTKCTALHPLSKTKREACNAGCDAKYQVRQESGQIIGAGSAIATQNAINQAAQAATLQQNGQTGAIPEMVGGTPASLPPTTTDVARTTQAQEEKKGMSMGVKIGIGLGALAILVIGGIIIAKRK